MSRLPALCLLLLLSSCASDQVARYGIETIRKGAEPREPRLIAVPPTLVLLREERVSRAFSTSVELWAARGETESSQLVYYAGEVDEGELRLVASDLRGPGGATLAPELGIVGYVPLRKPSLMGFHKRGDYPDPILPNAPFTVAPRLGQSLWYRLRVPLSAEPGLYSGRVSVLRRDGGESGLPVTLRVIDVSLPKTSFLKTSVNFRRESLRDNRYYGKNWSPELEAELPLLGLEYRFSSRVDLPLAEVFSAGPGGVLAEDWRAFDEAVEYWLGRGITCLELKLPIDWSTSARDIEEKFGARLEAIDAHLVSNGWADLFYFYFYDEPAASEMAALRERLDAIRSRAPDIRNVLTYGMTKAGEKALLGRVGIWVPNLHQLDPLFASRRKALGEEVWAYDCVANSFRPYPDNFRIDWYGTEHRALGWWLFKQGAQGFLYWAVDLWRVNPWQSTATFPWTNGDGVLFYPALDGKSPPYPSIRAELMRDAIEDYDLLTLLKRAYGGQAKPPAEVSELLEAKTLIPRADSFSTDDQAYIRCHERVLELLEAATATGPRRLPPNHGIALIVSGSLAGARD